MTSRDGNVRMVMVMERMRPLLLEPGDSLLVTSDIEDTVLRYGELSTRTGIPGDQLVLSFMSSLPLPRYEPLGPGESRWLGAVATELWAPIFWIPEEIAQRMPVGDSEAEGGIRGESDDEWSARIALHMVLAGLYVPESGTFLDVPAALGIDLQDEKIAERVQDWLEGHVDEELDALDPTPLWTPKSGDVDTAGVYFSLRDTWEDLFALSRYIGFDSVLRILDEISTRADEISVETAKEAGSYAVTLARLVAAEIGDVDLEAILSDAEANISVSTSTEEVLGFALPELVAALIESRDHYRERANQVVASGNAAVSTADSPDEKPSARQIAARRTTE